MLLADILDFTVLTKKKGATVELAITLSRFYEHIAAAAKSEGGRVIKLVGDGVLCAFVGVADHRARALRAVKKLLDGRATINDIAKLSQMPEIDYTVVVSTGRVLAGDLGADKLQGFDVIGTAVNRAFRLSHLATKRKVTHLIEAETLAGLSGAASPAVREVAAATAIDTGDDETKLYELTS